MGDPIPIPLMLADGFWPSVGSVGATRRPNSARDGLNVLWAGVGLMISANGLGAAAASGQGGERLYVLDDIIGTVNGTGSIIPFRGGTEIYCSKEGGAGRIIGSVQHDGTSGRVRYYNNGIERNVGLDAPVLAANSLSEGGASAINFTSSATRLVITRIRTTASLDGGSSKATLAESNGSEPSNTVAVTNKKVKLLFPAVGTGLDEHDAWGVYTTFRNQGTVGDFQYLMTILDSQLAGDRTFEFEWSDGDLDSLFNPPVSNNPPPLGEFVVNVGNVTVVLNTRDGMSYAASKPGFFQHYSSKGEGQYSPPARIRGCTMRPSDGTLIAWSDDAIFEGQLTGNEDFPFFFRAVLPDKGSNAPQGVTFADNEVYCYNGENGMFRLDGVGNPDESFAVPVRDYVRSLGVDETKVSVGHDPMYDGVVYCLGADMALIYMRSLSQVMGQPIWSVPYFLSANVGAAVTSQLLFKGKLVIGRDLGLFGFETGGANPDWFIVTAKQDGPNPMGRKLLAGYRIHCQMTGLIARLFLDDAEPDGADNANLRLTDAKTGDHYTNWKRVGAPCFNWTLRLEGPESAQRVEDIQFMVVYEDGMMHDGVPSVP